MEYMMKMHKKKHERHEHHKQKKEEGGKGTNQARRRKNAKGKAPPSSKPPREHQLTAGDVWSGEEMTGSKETNRRDWRRARVGFL